MNLNDSQKRAVEHFDGPCLCLAGPGSGKTAVLTCRIQRLIERGVDPEKICVLTFTKAAATEMQERFMRMSSQGNQVTFGTFHSLFWAILCKEYHLKSENILMGPQRLAIIKDVIRALDISLENGDEPADYLNEISFINNSCIEIDEYSSKNLDTENIRRVYKCFELKKEKYKLYEFDDMLKKAYELFQKDSEACSKWQQRFDYFLVDEMQDMNELQYKLICILSTEKRNLFCVGDDDQSIYGFRGAKPSLMQDFLRDFTDTERIVLNNNYRCPENVLTAACNIIEHNEDRLSKELKANKAPGDIEIKEVNDYVAESEYVISKLKELAANGMDYGDMTILYRNHCNVRFLVERLIEHGIPFYLKDRMPNVYTHFIIEDLLDYFQIAIGSATRARMLNIMNKPCRYIQRMALEKGYSFKDISEFYGDNPGMRIRVEAFEKDINLVSKMSPLSAVYYIRQGIGYERYLRELAMEKGNDPEEYIDVLNLFSECVRDCKTLKKAIEKIAMLRLKVDFENKNQSAIKDSKVGLYTLHSSKGLEFDAVFIIGANEGIMPTKRASKKEEIEAERRLFYVGVTRTKSKLFVSYSKHKNQDKLFPSRFIGEMELARPLE